MLIDAPCDHTAHLDTRPIYDLYTRLILGLCDLQGHWVMYSCLISFMMDQHLSNEQRNDMPFSLNERTFLRANDTSSKMRSI